MTKIKKLTNVTESSILLIGKPGYMKPGQKLTLQLTRGRGQRTFHPDKPTSVPLRLANIFLQTGMVVKFEGEA